MILVILVILVYSDSSDLIFEWLYSYFVRMYSQILWDYIPIFLGKLISPICGTYP